MKQPEILYHYCSNETLVSIISSKSIRLSSVKMSNDSLEGRLILDIFQETTLKNSATLQHNELIERIMKGLCNNVDALTFCLSEKDDLLSQWRGYAENGAGICIGFKKSELAKTQPEPQSIFEEIQLKRAIYKKTEQINAVLETLRQINQSPQLISLTQQLQEAKEQSDLFSNSEEIHMYEKKIEFLIGNALLRSWASAFTIKSDAFNEEKEWRLLKLHLSGTLSEYRACTDRIIPFISLPLDNSTSQPIASITLGPKNKTPREVIQSLLNASNFINVEINISKASYR